MSVINKIKYNGQDYDIGNNIEETLPIGTRVEFNGQAQDIPDGWQQVEDKGEIYSTTERRIGTWIDGKPLYRKVVNYTRQSSEQPSTYYDIDTDMFVIDYELTFCGEGLCVPDNYTGAGNEFIIGSYVGNSLHRFYICAKEVSSGKIPDWALDFRVTYRYTKTTDIVGGNE